MANKRVGVYAGGKLIATFRTSKYDAHVNYRGIRKSLGLPADIRGVRKSLGISVRRPVIRTPVVRRPVVKFPLKFKV